MKVTMQHTIDLDEVPSRLDQMANDIAVQLETIAKLAGVVDALNPDKFISQIDFIRKKLFSIDTQLDECVGLMRGYQNASNSSSSVSDDSPEAIHPPGRPSMDMETMLKNMGQMQLPQNADPAAIQKAMAQLQENLAEEAGEATQNE